MWLDSDLHIHAPEVGRRWLNSPPLSLSALRGRVVLIDFWDYTCVNCLRTLPYVQEWHRRYHAQGLSVIGVHTPEFGFAADEENVERAAKEFSLEYPIVLDSDYQIWQAYANRAWPAKYLIDQGGYLRFYHFGEGGYGETEAAVQRLLREINPHLELPRPMKPLRDTDMPGARCYPATPELYLGSARGRLGNEEGYAENKVRDYQAPDDRRPDLAYLDGPWYAAKEFVEACPLDGRPSRVLVHYNAAEVNLVMSPPGVEPAAGVVHVFQDGRPLSSEDSGEDVERQGGEAVVRVLQPRMYRLVKNREFGSHLLELSTTTAGLDAFAFTFVSCVQP